MVFRHTIHPLLPLQAAATICERTPVEPGVFMNTDAKNSCSNCERLTIQMDEKDREIQALLAKIDDLTRHDSLTGVLNRRTLIHILTAELQRSFRTGQPFSFAIINLDHFRDVNDKFGHPVGDIVLKTISETAMNLLRVLDRFGRLGGEEFGIILPATWLDQGVLAINRLTKAVAECEWQHITQGHAITFSTGITTNAPGDTAESIIKRAEKALLQAKTEGRNRIIQAEESLPEGIPINLDD
jgi:diguanylate cyclase (GGDEF)-like protein